MATVTTVTKMIAMKNCSTLELITEWKPPIHM